MTKRVRDFAREAMSATCVNFYGSDVTTKTGQALDGVS